MPKRQMRRNRRKTLAAAGTSEVMPEKHLTIIGLIQTMSSKWDFCRKESAMQSKNDQVCSSDISKLMTLINITSNRILWWWIFQRQQCQSGNNREASPRHAGGPATYKRRSRK